MPIIYEIFYIKLYERNEFITQDEAIKRMNALITNKMIDGWNPVGGVTWAYEDGTCVSINQAMTLRL
jgi:hypothetical protein